jgi:hypothetical protein
MSAAAWPAVLGRYRKSTALSIDQICQSPHSF